MRCIFLFAAGYTLIIEGRFFIGICLVVCSLTMQGK